MRASATLPTASDRCQPAAGTTRQRRKKATRPHTAPGSRSQDSVTKRDRAHWHHTERRLVLLDRLIPIKIFENRLPQSPAARSAAVHWTQWTETTRQNDAMCHPRPS
jgi:hypothetical protein